MKAGLIAPQDVIEAEGYDMEEVYNRIAEAQALARKLGITIDYGTRTQTLGTSQPPGANCKRWRLPSRRGGRMIRDLAHIYARIYCVPLLIQSDKLDSLLAGLEAATMHRGSLLQVTAEDGAAVEPAQPEAVPYGYRLSKGVATVPIHGVTDPPPR